MERQQPDPYAVLGVARDATQTTIGHAYRALLRRHHPDTRDAQAAAASDAALQQVLAAYAILRDPERRAAYDLEQRPAPPRRPADDGPPSIRTPWSASNRSPIRAGPVRWWPATAPSRRWE